MLGSIDLLWLRLRLELLLLLMVMMVLLARVVWVECSTKVMTTSVSKMWVVAMMESTTAATCRKISWDKLRSES